MYLLISENQSSQLAEMDRHNLRREEVIEFDQQANLIRTVRRELQIK